MNYQRTYDLLIQSARSKAPTGYVESHHVLPRCLGGTDDEENLVAMSARAHFIAHRLLVKMHPGVLGLSWAAYMMSSRHRFGMRQSRAYAELKAAAARDISATMKGRPKRQTERMKAAYGRRVGVPLSEATKAKVGAASKGRVASEETRAKISIAAKLRPEPTDETRAKISSSLMGNSRRKGIPNTPDAIERTRKANVGRKPTAETLAKRAAARRQITDESIRGVRADAVLGGFTHSQIAQRNATSKSQVGRILRGQKYAQVV